MQDEKFPIGNVDMSTFSFNHVHKTSGDMGMLIPIHTQVTLPGDKFVKTDVSAFVRGMPTIAPILDKIDIKINHFYVPYRVLWNKWEQFYSRSQEHTYTGASQPQFPVLGVKDPAVQPLLDPNYPTGRLGDYMGTSLYYKGVPSSSVDKPDPVSAFPFLAYNKIWLDYFIPQRWMQYNELNDNTPWYAEMKNTRKYLEQIRKGDGGIVFDALGSDISGEFGNIYHLKSIGWNHDYFTNALPKPDLFDGSRFLINDPTKGYAYVVYQGSPTDAFDPNVGDNGKALPLIKDLRKSIATQHYLEKLSYSGGRYEETTMVFWSQDIKNRTLQRSEYLGGGVVPLFTNEVESTASTTGASLGDLAGKPVGSGYVNGESFIADEFGIYMITAHLVPKRTYSDAMSKALFFTTDIDELPNPEFQGIGDEAIYRYEVDGKSFGATTFNAIWGYVPRYAQYKMALDRFSGEMRKTLLHWHLGTTADELNNFNSISPEFIKCNPRTDIFQVDEPDKFIMTFGFDIVAQRKLSKNVMPGMSRI